MTANRWWVKVGARWLARIDGVSEQLRLLFLALTGYGVVSDLLITLGYGKLILPFLGVNAILLAIYTYLYNEGGVRNQVRRDTSDLETNWAGPNQRVLAELIVAGIMASRLERELTKEEREPIENELDNVFDKLRDGIDIE